MDNLNHFCNKPQSKHHSKKHLKALLVCLLLPFLAFTEGSKDFVDYPGMRMFLDTRDPQQLKVYANAGETINVGSSHVGLSLGFIKVYRPDGSLAATFDNTGATNGLAIIYNNTQEMAGPTGGGSTNGAGYVPGTVPVASNETGIWTVIFDYPDYNFFGFNELLNNQPWTRAANQPPQMTAVLAWDITVTVGGAGNAGGVPQEGRLYSNEHITLMNGNGLSTSPIFYVLTKDGYLYQVNFMDTDPFRFPISSNSLGLVNGSGNPIYKSKMEADFQRDNDPISWDLNALYLYEPQAQDNGPLVNNKVFFNLPDPNLPSSATVTDIYRNNTHTTWLRSEITELTLNSPIYLVGAPGSAEPCYPGSIQYGSGGSFIFETNIGGVVTLELDLNNNGNFSDPVDRTLYGSIMQGIDSLQWDGKDGQGDFIPVQDNFVLRIQGFIRFGESHIAFTDIENCPGGVTFEWLNPLPGFAADQFYYDHSDLGGAVSGGGTPGNALPTSQPFTYAGNFGNDRYFDHWFLTMKPIPLSRITVDIVPDCFTQPSDTEVEIFVGGFDHPLEVVNCGDDRLFVAEQGGKVWILDANGNKLPTPYLDLSASVGNQNAQQGLLGLAFHPNYANNGRFFVFYASQNGYAKLSRFQVDANNPNQADPASEVPLFEVPNLSGQHLGGGLRFGPDGYLYIGFGDGSSDGDLANMAQFRFSVLGKLLRIDVDDPTNPVTTPPTNPFASGVDAVSLIWGIGLQNPWRFSFDRATGDLWLGDVGMDSWEEINFQAHSSTGGEDYGWHCFEGTHHYNTASCTGLGDKTFPIHEYPNFFNYGCSVIGGQVYRGCEYPSLYGHYLFTDYCSGILWSIRPNGTGWQVDRLADLADNTFASFGENKDGTVFLVGHGDGNIYKITSSAPFLSAIGETCAGAADGTITMPSLNDPLASFVWNDGNNEANRQDLTAGIYTVNIATGSGCQIIQSIEVPQGAPIPAPDIAISQDTILSTSTSAASYQWLLNGNPIPGATDSIYTATESGDYAVVIKTALGCEAVSATVNVVVPPSNTLEKLGFHSASLTPNPTSAFVNLSLTTSHNIDFELVVSNVQGKTLRKELFTASGTFRHQFDLRNLPGSTYYFTIKTAQGQWTGKVVRQ